MTSPPLIPTDPNRRQAVIGALAATVAGGSAASAQASPPAAPIAPRRVVSLNACLDAILVHVADRGQITALSHYARQPASSPISDIAASLPFTWETAEEVIALRPDLVLNGQHTAPATRNALTRLGVRMALFKVPKTIEQSLDQVQEVADLVGRPERGRALNARIRSAIAASAPPPGTPRLSALIYQPNGFAAGRGTLMDEMMTHAGFDNVAARYGLKSWGNVGLERLIADPPQVLLSGDPSPGARTWADRIMTHPALAAIAPRMQRARLPERLIYCGGPVLIQTAAALVAARQSLTHPSLQHPSLRNTPA